ncbi:MAG: MATE family efflux transporter [Anaerolineaceae bacterium]|jgi:putative MATE family efflux protein|nr:MATE family efflux transporter [Anaerolineaceae bacterium]
MWDKNFLSRLVRLGLPIMLQNLFGVLGNSVTTLMTGKLGDVPIAAAGLSNQLYFILSLVQFGVSSGASIFTAQFWGNRDRESVLKALGISLTLGAGVGALFMVIALFFPYSFLSLFTKDQEVIPIAASLLKIAGFSFLVTPVVITYSFILRSTGNVRLPMLVSTVGVGLNTLLGYGLIFGKLGFPNLGVNGAAAANLIARVVECLVLVWLVYRLKTPLAAPLRQLFSFDQAFLKRVLHRILPVMTNELIWSLGITAYAAIYARLGTEAYAAVAIKDTIENLIFVPFIGIANACAILVGNTIGAGKKEAAQGFVMQSVKINFGIGLLLGLLLGLGRHIIISYFNIEDVTRGFAENLVLVLASTLWIRACNVLFFIGMMRSGGDIRFAIRMDVGSMWLLGVPLALLAAFIFQLPVYFVYLAVMAEEAFKFFMSVWRYKSKRWIHDLISA